MGSMARREAGSQDTADPQVTQGLPDTPVSQLLAEFRDLGLSLDNEDP
ncbi:MAG TPA: hypothetical protein VK574_07470 [Terracidiphilus sp.]|nr:hypothetical protein [Terracidiphilus sp.]